MAKKKKYETMPAGEMRAKYGLYAENKRAIKLDQSKVPQALRHLIPLAEHWGESDDLIRADLIKKASARELRSLKRAMADHCDPLNTWLAGPEADGPKFSAEYVAFSCMRMAADEIV